MFQIESPEACDWLHTKMEYTQHCKSYTHREIQKEQSNIEPQMANLDSFSISKLANKDWHFF